MDDAPKRPKSAIAALRAELGLTLDEFAARLGLASKGQAHAIEADGKCSVRVALLIEEMSGGSIPASELNTDIGLVETARGLSPNHDEHAA